MTKPKNTKYVQPGEKEDHEDYTNSMYGPGYDEEADREANLELARKLHKENPDEYPDPDAVVDQTIVEAPAENVVDEFEDNVVPLDKEKVAKNLGLIDESQTYDPPFEPVGMLLASITNMHPDDNSESTFVQLRIKNSEPYVMDLMQRYLKKQDIVVCLLPDEGNDNGETVAGST